jgi:hypothetical protein
MFKCLKFLGRNVGTLNAQIIFRKRFCEISIQDKIKKCLMRENKYYILASSNSLTEEFDDNINEKDSSFFYLAGLYSRFYKLKGKTVVNSIFNSKKIDQSDSDFDFVNEKSSQEFEKKMLNILIENNLVIEKDKEYYLKMKDSDLFESY